MQLTFAAGVRDAPGSRWQTRNGGFPREDIAGVTLVLHRCPGDEHGHVLAAVLAIFDGRRGRTLQHYKEGKKIIKPSEKQVPQPPPVG